MNATETTETTEIAATAVKAGQDITEVDTPEGPWYRVAKVNAKSLVVYLDAEFPEDGTVRIPVTADHVVLARAGV